MTEESDPAGEHERAARIRRLIESAPLAGASSASERSIDQMIEAAEALTMGKVPGGGRTYPFSQDAVALSFASLFKHELRYDHHRSRWFRWVGGRWRQDETELAFEYARTLGRDIAEQAEEKSANREAGTVKFAYGVERFARSDRRLACTSDVWDTDNWLLGTPGGVVDLRTGRLSPSRPADMITKLTAVAPAPEPHCPIWLSFLNDITRGNADYMRFLRQWAGYSLTGSTREHALAFAYGDGGNGKGVFVNTLAGMMGDYATTAPMEAFTESRGERHPTEIAMLRGARLVVASETEDGRAWAESRIKQLTGGDRVAARFMRGDFFEFVPTFKLTFMGNHRPVLRNVGAAERRRFNLLPFTFKPETPDQDLTTKLREEWPAILTWAIDGCLDWQENRLVRPAVVEEATADYFAQQDVLGAWIAEALDVDHGNDLRFETTAALFQSWKDHATAAGEPVGTRRAFSDKLKSRGFELRRRNVVRGFMGVRLKQAAINEPW